VLFRSIPIIYAAVGTAAVNTLVGFAFLSIYRHRLRPSSWLWIGHALLAGLLVVLAVFGTEWTTRLGDTLFQDRVVYRLQTPYQNAVITKRHVARGKPDVLSLYLNGRLQFASNDERIYHAYLTSPAMAATYRRERLLVLGGGDGLALRDLLRWNPDSVTLIDIDAEVVGLFSGEDPNAPAWLSHTLVELNEGAFADPRVVVVQADAFIEVERLAAEGETFDVVVVDLPDPGHPDLNRLYSDYFYARIGQLLSPDGVLALQSTSPFHAKSAFLSIGKTVSHVGFNTEQFHANVPSFGEWGWTIGTLRGQPASERIADAEAGPTPDGWLDREQILAAFAFPNGYYADLDDVRINRLGSHVVYGYHQEALQEYRGVFFAGRSGNRPR